MEIDNGVLSKFGKLDARPIDEAKMKLKPEKRFGLDTVKAPEWAPPRTLDICEKRKRA